MRYPWVNVALIVLLVIQAVSGYAGFVNGRPAHAWLLWVHGIGAYALVFLMLFKAVIIVDALRRRRRRPWQRAAFIVLLALTVLTLLSGMAWTFAGPIYVGGFSLVTMHIFVAVPVIGLWLWHTWHMRWITRLPAARDRRAFMRGGAVAAAGGLAWLAAGVGKRLLGLPGAARRFTGSYETGSFTGIFPRVSWIADRPPPVDAAAWRLLVDGGFGRILPLTYADLQALPQTELTATLDCTGGWYTTQVWRGVTLEQVLALAEIRPNARSITITAVSGYRRRFPLPAARRYLLALAVADAPLPHGHGFPVRLVAPDQRGVNWVKWVERITVEPDGAWRQSPLPLQ